MVGCNTLKIDNPMLTVRYIKGKSPVRVVPCSKADLSLDYNIFSKESPTIIATSESAPKGNIENIVMRGAKVVVVGDKKVDLRLLLNELYNRGIRRLIVEGGPTIAWTMLKDKLIDEIKLIHMPFIVGGSDTPSLIGGEGVGELNKAIHTELIDYFMRGKHLITEYKVLYD
ncbi:MAG: dihydrofolate reductase family protein [Halobacteriota archaeon]